MTRRKDSFAVSDLALPEPEHKTFIKRFSFLLGDFPKRENSTALRVYTEDRSDAVA